MGVDADGLETGLVAGFLPAVVQRAPVEVVVERRFGDVLHLVVERRSEYVGPEAVTQVDAGRKALVENRGSDDALQSGSRGAHHHLVVGVVLERIAAVLADEDLASRGGVDAVRPHGPDVVGAGAVVITLEGRGAALLVHEVEFVADVAVLRVVLAERGVHAPAQVLPFHDHHVETARKALRDLTAEIGVDARRAQRRGHGNLGQQRVGVLVVEIHRELHAVEDVDVETEVLVDGFLPFEIRVAELFEDRAGPEEILVGGVVDVGSRSRVGVEILVSGVTDREAQLQQVEPFGLAPRLVVDVPPHTGCGRSSCR